jgi:hypothetical protein
MRSRRRRLAPLLVAVLVASGLAALAASCGTDAVGIDACRQIELARCDEAPVCAAGFDVDRCREIYRDQCLHGIENTAHPPSDAEIADCVAAIKAVSACKQRGAATMKDCDVPLADGVVPSTLSPCDVLMSDAHLLQKCAFAAAPADAGAAPPQAVDAASDAPADAAPAADAGADAAPPVDASTDAAHDAG